MAIVCIAMLTQASNVNAQSGARTMNGSAKKGSATKQATMAKGTTSRAFTNGFNVPSTGLALEGYCPVCYLAANKAVKGTADFAHDYQGVTYWFVNDSARQAFIANPKKYLPAYGGWCGLGVAMGQRFPVDPTNFKIVDGRIMLFLKNSKVDGVGIWNQDEASNLKKADANWKKLGS
jgi:YHS domain-containing protein